MQERCCLVSDTVLTSSSFSLFYSLENFRVAQKQTIANTKWRLITYTITKLNGIQFKFITFPKL